VINRALRAQRAAAADPYVADVSAERSLVIRIGYGLGEALAEGRFAEALELRPAAPGASSAQWRRPRSASPRCWAGASRPWWPRSSSCARRCDLDAGRSREAALQARVALEALAAELPGIDLEPWRGPIADAANEALSDEPPRSTLVEAVSAMESALRRHRLGA
jgi:hypothetical protein